MADLVRWIMKDNAPTKRKISKFVLWFFGLSFIGLFKINFNSTIFADFITVKLVFGILLVLIGLWIHKNTV